MERRKKYTYLLNITEENGYILALPILHVCVRERARARLYVMCCSVFEC